MVKFLKRKIKVLKKTKDINNVHFVKKRIYPCFLHVSGTTNNTFLTLVKKGGDVIGSLSSGRFKNMRGKKKKCGIFVAQKMGYILGLKGFFLNFIKVGIVVRTPLIPRSIYAIMTGLSNSGVQVVSLINYYPYARNGVKLKKVRRK